MGNTNLQVHINNQSRERANNPSIELNNFLFQIHQKCGIKMNAIFITKFKINLQANTSKQLLEIISCISHAEQ